MKIDRGIIIILLAVILLIISAYTNFSLIGGFFLLGVGVSQLGKYWETDKE